MTTFTLNGHAARSGTGNPRQDVLDRLQGVVESQGGNAWSARCPAHDDRRASLSVSVGRDGRILLRCHAGCETPAVVKALDLHMQDLFPADNAAPTARRIVAAYDYVDEAGVLLYQAVRYDPKGFSQRRPDGAGGWTWSLKGVRRVLYRLPGLLAAPPEQLVFVVEGEKDADRLAGLGLVGTTNAMGAGKWRPEYNESLRGRHVVIIPDNDDAGHAHAAQVARSLHGVAASVKVLELAGLPPKGDVSNWLTAGGAAAELLRLAEGAPESGPDESPHAVPTTPPAGETGGETLPHLTDTGNAQRFRRDHGAEVRYCGPWSRWLAWDGRRWQLDEMQVVKALAKRTVLQFFDWASSKVEEAGQRLAAAGEGDKARVKEELARVQRVLSWALQSESAPRINAMLDLARSEDGVPILPGDLDADGWRLNVQNGTINLKTGELRPHRKEDLITKLARVTFDRSARCPLWDRFVSEVMDGNADLVAYLRRVVGYSLTGDVREQCLFFFHGSGANGKSTFLDILLALLGDYACQAVPELLMVRQGETHPTERADLFGRRFVACVEVDEGKRLAEALLKQLTGGDRIRARRMREDYWEFSPTHKLFIAANHRPLIRGSDFAVWRRIKLIPFNVTFGDDRKDPDLPQKLRAELSGILNWALGGCLQWQRNGLGEPDEVRQAVGAYQSEMDLVARFVAECCACNADARASSRDLYAGFVRWCEEGGCHPPTRDWFGRRLKEKGYDNQRSGANNLTMWHGLTLQAQ